MINSMKKLTIREKEVLVLVTEGLSDQEIAEKLFVSRATVKQHVHHILQKLYVKNRAHAAVLAIKNNLLEEV